MWVEFQILLYYHRACRWELFHFGGSRSAAKKLIIINFFLPPTETQNQHTFSSIHIIEASTSTLFFINLEISTTCILIRKDSLLSSPTTSRHNPHQLQQDLQQNVISHICWLTTSQMVMAAVRIHSFKTNSLWKSTSQIKVMTKTSINCLNSGFQKKAHIFIFYCLLILIYWFAH